MQRDLVVGADGLARCLWAAGPADYIAYHDDEWGHPVRDEHGVYERLMLEAFQSGLSWLTILRKREAFRAAFAGFDPEVVATFADGDIARLMADAGIVRNRAKIRAAITNAKATLALRDDGGLADFVWSFQPAGWPIPLSSADIRSSTPESTTLAKELKRRGFVFLGPTTVHAAMQAIGIVNDHLAGCAFRELPNATRSSER